VSELNQKIYAQIESWRNRPIEGNHPYVFLDGLWLKRSCGGEVRNVSLLVATGVNEEGFSRSAGRGGRLDKRQGEQDSVSAAPESASSFQR
jgi:putative transposase